MADDMKWEVKDGKFNLGGMIAASGCHHRNDASACGGCYFRLMTALQAVADAKCECKADTSGFANMVLEACKAEQKPDQRAALSGTLVKWRADWTNASDGGVTFVRALDAEGAKEKALIELRSAGRDDALLVVRVSADVRYP